MHDLCLLTVQANLHVRTKVADRSPNSFEAASISGHPSLFPTIITKGHFGGKLIVNVLSVDEPVARVPKS